MGILHIVNKSPFTHNTLRSCIAVCTHEDTLLLIEDGVYGAIQNMPDTSALLPLIDAKMAFYALSSDVKARAIEKKISAQVQLINYDEFVKLTLSHNPIQSWF